MTYGISGCLARPSECFVRGPGLPFPAFPPSLALSPGPCSPRVALPASVPLALSSPVRILPVVWAHSCCRPTRHFSGSSGRDKRLSSLPHRPLRATGDNTAHIAYQAGPRLSPASPRGLRACPRSRVLGLASRGGCSLEAPPPRLNSAHLAACVCLTCCFCA